MWTWWVRRSSRAPVSCSEPKTSVHSSKGRLVVTRTEAPFVALAEDLEEEFRPGGGQGDEAEFVDDQQPEAGQLPLQIEQAPFVPGLHEFVDQGGGGGEAHGQPPMTGGQAQGDVGLAGAAISDGDDILPVLEVFTPGQFHDQGLVHRGDGQEVEAVQRFDGGETCGPDPAIYHALVSVDEFQFGEPEQVLGVVHILGRRTGRPACGTLSGR